MIRRLAGEQQYQIDPIERAYRLTALLAEVADHRYLANVLVLKGGTALNLYLGAMERLSVDADLNFVGTLETSELDAAKKQVFQAVEAIARERGYAPEVSQDTHALRAYMLRYKNANGGSNLIKLDLNFLDRATVTPPQQAKPPSIFSIEGPPVNCLSLTELAGTKLATMMLRGAARDVFDVANLAWDKVDEPFARKIAIFHGLLDHAKLANFDPHRAAKLEKRHWDSDVRNLLRKGTNVDMEATKTNATKRASSVLPLQGEEIDCQRVLINGEWRPDLLFAPFRHNDAIAKHPGMAWRIKNPDARLPT